MTGYSSLQKRSRNFFHIGFTNDDDSSHANLHKGLLALHKARNILLMLA